MRLKVLCGCEFSGRIRDAFRALGHAAYSCDLLPSETPGFHIKGDALAVLDWGWDIMIANPPCTYLSHSSASALHRRDGQGLLIRDEARWEEMLKGVEFFKKLLEAPIPHIAVENPVMLSYAKELIGRDYDQLIQPFEHGDPFRKRTCLWLKNLPLLQPTNILQPTWYNSKGLPRWDNQTDGGHEKSSPSLDRWKIRSRTFPGIAAAMAKQYSEYVIKERENATISLDR